MRRFLAVFLVLSGLTLTACGGSSNKTATNSGAAKSTTSSAASSGSDDGSSTTTAGSGSGDVDCTAVKAAAAKFIVEVQYLAQLKNKDAYALIKDGTVSFDPTQMAADLETLRALEDVDISPLQPAGAVKKSLDTYAQANDLAKQNLAVDDPFTQAKGQELADLTSNIADFLGGQAAISEAISKACG